MTEFMYFSKNPLDDSITLDKAVTAASFSTIIPSSINLNKPSIKLSKCNEISLYSMDSAKFTMADAEWARTRGMSSESIYMSFGNKSFPYVY